MFIICLLILIASKRHMSLPGIIVCVLTCNSIHPIVFLIGPDLCSNPAVASTHIHRRSLNRCCPTIRSLWSFQHMDHFSSHLHSSFNSNPSLSTQSNRANELCLVPQLDTLSFFLSSNHY